jgi:hypothetical protein
MEIKPGFYRVLQYPFFFGNIVTGFEGLYVDNIQLIKELDINSMFGKLFPWKNKRQVTAHECCVDCLHKYTGQAKLTNNYVDKIYGRQRIAFERKVIKSGK